MSRWRKPSQFEMGVARMLLQPAYWLTAPLVTGLDNIPQERPLLFVGNHTMYGILDLPFLFAELNDKQGILLRGLGDHVHFKLPVWRDMLVRYGMVAGTRENCARLMRQGECVLVFPGGAREVAKRRGEKNRLVWQERTGFAHMAIQHGCTIVPFASLGVDDAFDIGLDADDIWDSPVGGLLKRVGIRRAATVPVPSAVRPERIYFHFAQPVRTDGYAPEDAEDIAARRAVRDQVAERIETALEDMIAAREDDPDRSLAHRVRKRWLGR